MGAYMFILRLGTGRAESILGVVLLAITIATDPYTASDPALASILTLFKSQLSLLISIYGSLARCCQYSCSYVPGTTSPEVMIMEVKKWIAFYTLVLYL
jgi:hypothetical protein